MTPQEKVLLFGVGGAAVAKFYFHKSWMIAAIAGLAVIAAHDLLTAQSTASA